MQKDRRLDGAKFHRAVERAGARPGFAKVRRAFHVNTPASVLRARAAQERPTRKFDWFVARRAHDFLRQTSRFGPGAAVIPGSFHHSPPAFGAWSDFVEQQQRSVFRHEQNRIPTRITTPFFGLISVRNLRRSRPTAGFIAREPD